MRIGVVSIQGDVSEHLDMVDGAFKDADMKGKGMLVKRPADMGSVAGLVLPGGESTTISKLMVQFGLFDEILRRVEADDLPILGTCAGCILLAKRGDREVSKTKTRLLSLMDMRVDRNAYGRQADSFESPIRFEPGKGPTKWAANGLDFKRPFNAVFIRAPRIIETYGKCKVLCVREKEILVAQEGRRVALTFHPELTGDSRMHRYFLNLAME